MIKRAQLLVREVREGEPCNATQALFRLCWVLHSWKESQTFEKNREELRTMNKLNALPGELGIELFGALVNVSAPCPTGTL